MKPFQMLKMGILLAAISCMNCMSAQATGTLVISNIANSNASSNPVCYDINGALSRCDSTSLSPANIAIVAQSGGTYTSPVDAIANISQGDKWCSPDANNRCLIKVAPGVYDIGDVSLLLPEYVSMEGSGETVTRIVGSASATDNGVIIMNDNQELRSITILNRAAAAYANAIYIQNGSPKITHVTALSINSSLKCSAHKVYYSTPFISNSTLHSDCLTSNAFQATGSSTDIQSTRIIDNSLALDPETPEGYGIFLDESDIRLNFVKLTTNGYGVFSRSFDFNGQLIHVDHSDISSELDLFVDHFPFVPSDFYVGSSKLSGPQNLHPDSITCINAYSANYIALSVDCD